MLHITNGDVAVHLIQAARIPGDVFAWQDVLHEGPMPGSRSLAELSEIRARFGVTQGWGTLSDLQAQFRQHDARVAAFADYAEVILWFERDLYDQLQLIQLLDWFARQELGGTRLSFNMHRSVSRRLRFSWLGKSDTMSNAEPVWHPKSGLGSAI